MLAAEAVEDLVGARKALHTHSHNALTHSMLENKRR